MKAMVLQAADTPFVMTDLPDPVAGPGEAVARVLACGAGLTIQHVRAGRAPVDYPRIIGHEITAEIVDFPDDQGTGAMLVDSIEDRAGQKGTGKWTTTAALDLGMPIPAITAAVDARLLSAMKDERLRAATVYQSESPTDAQASSQAALDAQPEPLIDEVRRALYAAKICSYAQGFSLLLAASREYDYGLDLGEIARIWKGGCIIRAVFLDRIRTAFDRDAELPNLLVDPDFAQEITEHLGAWRSVVRGAAGWGIPVPALSASLAYFDSYRSPRLPANLLQAQRDYFGAHTYGRTDREGTFHTNWSREDGA